MDGMIVVITGTLSIGRNDLKTKFESLGAKDLFQVYQKYKYFGCW